jgi:hypothetical protein
MFHKAAWSEVHNLQPQHICNNVALQFGGLHRRSIGSSATDQQIGLLRKKKKMGYRVCSSGYAATNTS